MQTKNHPQISKGEIYKKSMKIINTQEESQKQKKTTTNKKE